jgi:hypothetical protein
MELIDPLMKWIVALIASEQGVTDEQLDAIFGLGG